MRLSHGWSRGAAVFDDENLVSCAGLVPVMELAEQAGLSDLLGEHVVFRCERIRSGAANPTPKLTSVIAGLLTGADSIDDLNMIRAGGMKRLFGDVYAPATLGILLREFTGGHVRQLHAVLRRHLLALTQRTGVLDGIAISRALVDIDSLLRPVYGHAREGASFGHTKIANRQVLRKGIVPAGDHHQHCDGRPGAGRDPAPGREGRLRQGRGQHGHRSGQHRESRWCERYPGSR